MFQQKLWLLPLALAAANSVLAAEKPRPRGVGPEFGKYYKDLETFVCISNPSIKLSQSQVNDDFCDCPDGSDEPGTSACSYLSELSPKTPADVPVQDYNVSLALPGFYCKNKGHRPAYIPFLSVNDGICDYSLCCDGSDEWAQVGGIRCEDRCKDIGVKWRTEDEQRQKSLGVASRKRHEMVAQAQRLRREVLDRIQAAETEIKADNIKIEGLEKTLTDAERKERGRVVKKPRSGGKLATLAQLARDRVEELRATLLDAQSQLNERKARILALEKILSTFKEEYNPNFNDEGVKRAVRSYEDYAANNHPSLSADADGDMEELVRPDSETNVINWADFESSEESDVDVLYKFEEYLPQAMRDWIDEKLRALRIILVENGVVAAYSDTKNESAELSQARSGLQAAREVRDENQRRLDEQNSDLSKDYGADDIFRVMQGRCIERASGEYTYEMCWMTHTKQKSKKGGSDTLMGTFFGFQRIMVDDDVPANGKGLGRGERLALKYENGQGCWNGPSRSTLVVLACAERDELWKISEEEKCVYRMEAGTPAVCNLSSPAANHEGMTTDKDEL